MKKIFLVCTMIVGVFVFFSCNGEESDESKKTEFCDCFEKGGRVVQTDECREIAMKAKANKIEACDKKK